MKSTLIFIAGFVLGMFWRNWVELFYGLPKAVIRGILDAIKYIKIAWKRGTLSRYELIKRIPEAVWNRIKFYVKWEWIEGATIE
jgi:hypothetical protein